MKDKDYFNSDEFKRRADARAREEGGDFNIITGREAQRIHQNYVKNQLKRKWDAKAGK